MSQIDIQVEAGSSVKLLTAGKYCDKDIVVTAGAGGVTKEEQEKTIDITENGTTEVTPDEGKALSKVTVNVAVGDGDSFYDAFWDAYQQNGARRDYARAFRGAWTNESFKPKYDIIVTGSSDSMFAYSNISGDLTQILEDCEVSLDFSGCASAMASFQGCKFTRVPHVQASGSFNTTFYGATSLITIDKITTNAKVNYPQTFNICNALVNVTFEGEIGENIAFAQSSLLSDASVQSIIDHLADLTGSTAQTLSLNSVVFNKLTEEQIVTIASKNWTVQ